MSKRHKKHRKHGQKPDKRAKAAAPKRAPRRRVARAAALPTLNLIVDPESAASGLYLRREPVRAPATVLTVLPAGAALIALEDADTVLARIGNPAQWLRVQDEHGREGVVNAAYVLVQGAPPPAQAIRLSVIDAVAGSGGLRLRDAPGLHGAVLAQLPAGTNLIALDAADEVAARLGLLGAWLHVRDPLGREGFVAAWYVRRAQEISPARIAQGVVLATADTVLRAVPSADAPALWRITAGTPLRVDDGPDWASRVGDPGRFVRVTSYAFKRGYVAGDALRVAELDTRPAVADAAVAVGESAWLFGIHDPYDRGLHSAGRRGWVLFTEQVSGAGNPACAAWADAGWGVISRLNNDYGGSGTIPTPGGHAAFAARCADHVRNTPGCHVWIIGNEMNNPREWPNQDETNPGNNAGDAITPERYAECYNRVRAAIKAVDPAHQVLPGAIDPYNARAGSCLAWFERMLARLDDVDGFALHAYTQGGSAALVSNLQTFGDDPLTWQYYHFRCYTTLLDVIPQRWRDRPVYLTETNPSPTASEPAWSGGQNGWVQAAYAEVQRWNLQPHAQQIRALLLYRWIVGGGSDAQFSLLRLPGPQADFRATVAGNDYRWRN